MSAMGREITNGGVATQPCRSPSRRNSDVRARTENVSVRARREWREEQDADEELSSARAHGLSTWAARAVQVDRKLTAVDVGRGVVVRAEGRGCQRIFGIEDGFAGGAKGAE